MWKQDASLDNFMLQVAKNEIRNPNYFRIRYNPKRSVVRKEKDMQK